MVPRARTGDSSNAPSAEAAEEIERVIYPYGVGIDCHSRFIQVCVLVATGGVIRRAERTFATTWDRLLASVAWARETVGEGLAEEVEPRLFRYTLESTGTYHLPVILAWGGVPSVVNPLLAGHTRRKTDVLDARLLAHHSITGLWRASFIPPMDVQSLRVAVAHRREAARARTRVSNRLNNIALRFGHTFGQFGTANDGCGRAILEDLARGSVPDVEGVAPFVLPAPVRDVFSELLADHERANRAVAVREKAMTAWADQCEFVCGTGEVMDGRRLRALLETVPGVGPVSAVVWMSEVVDIRRFDHAKNPAKALAAYAGCDPSLKVSAGKVTEHVRRRGNSLLHGALMQLASTLIRTRREPFGVWGYGVYKRHEKGGWKKACGAVGRRVALGLYHVQRTGEPFSYDKYTFWAVPTVRNMPTAEMGIDARFVRVLLREGLETTQAVVNAAYSDLAGKKGVGPKCLNAIRSWAEANRLDSSPAAKSSDGAADGKPAKAKSRPRL